MKKVILMFVAIFSLVACKKDELASPPDNIYGEWYAKSNETGNNLVEEVALRLSFSKGYENNTPTFSAQISGKTDGKWHNEYLKGEYTYNPKNGEVMMIYDYLPQALEVAGWRKEMKATANGDVLTLYDGTTKLNRISRGGY